MRWFNAAMLVIEPLFSLSVIPGSPLPVGSKLLLLLPLIGMFGIGLAILLLRLIDYILISQE